MAISFPTSSLSASGHSQQSFPRAQGILPSFSPTEQSIPSISLLKTRSHMPALGLTPLPSYSLSIFHLYFGAPPPPNGSIRLPSTISLSKPGLVSAVLAPVVSPTSPLYVPSLPLLPFSAARAPARGSILDSWIVTSRPTEPWIGD